MNLHFKRLAQEAEFYPADIQYQGDNIQRFGELVVAECVKILISQKISTADPTQKEATWNSTVNFCINKLEQSMLKPQI